MNNLLNFKSFVKFLSHNKAYTAIDIFGLSVSLMFVVLIAVYTVQELSTDGFQEKGDRIYVLGSDRGPGTAYPIARRIQERYPEVEQVCPVICSKYSMAPVVWKDKNIKASVLFADSTFFDMFSFRLITGNKEQALQSGDYVIISETFSHKLFGNEDPIGQTVDVKGVTGFTVNGIMKDIKNSVIPYADVIVPISNIHAFNSTVDKTSLANAGSTVAFLLAKEGADLQPRCDDLFDWFKEFFWIYHRGISTEVTLTPIKEYYFSGSDNFLLQTGDWKFVMILMSVGLIILVFAVINYINLTVAQAGFRAKEMATRRLLGSSRKELFSRLILESTALTVLSFGVGLLLAVAMVPYANDLLQTKIDLSTVFSPPGIGICVTGILVIGILAGLLPALVVSNAKPIEVVRGGFHTRNKMVFSRFFITFQNVITIVLVACSITMIAQINHLIHAPLGYNTTNIIEIENTFDDYTALSTFVNELRQKPFVKRVGLSQGAPFSGSNNNTTVYEGKNISFQTFTCDQEFFDMLGFQKLRENHLSGPGWYLNQQALKEMGLPEDAQSFQLEGEVSIGVAGIIKDFQLSNITGSKHPVKLRIVPSEKVEPWQLMVEVEGDPFVAREGVKNIYENLARMEYTGMFIDQQIEESFAAQRRTSEIVSIFAGIAVLISLLGLLAMSTYFLQQRMLEVAVRKVFGSTNREILRKLVGTFLSYVGIAFVVAVPVIWYFMKKWLSDYAYRIDLNPLIFIFAGLFCLFISFITVFLQSWRTANLNPVTNFRNKQQ